VVHVVTTGLYRFISLLLTDYVELLSLSVSVCRRCSLLFVSLWGRSRIWRQNGANFADLFIYWKLLFYLSQ